MQIGRRRTQAKYYLSMNSSVDDLSDGQYESLQQFRRDLSDVLPHNYSDAWLLKWLRANSFDRKKAEYLFRADRRARTVYEMDSLVENYVKPEVALKYEFTSCIGIAKNGSPVRYTRFGDGDLMGFLMSLSGYEIALYCSHINESDMALLRKENERRGREVNEVTYILDLDGLSIASFVHKCLIETGLDLVSLIQEHYPEIWGNIFIVNVPMYFDRAFNLFKPIIRLNLLQKIRMASRENTPNLLLRYIDDDILPAFLGGKRIDDCGSPRCSQFVKFGGKVPEEYYIRNRTPLLPSDPGVMSVWVSARSVYNHTVIVRQAPSKIRIEFRTENGSIGLKMLLRDLREHLDVPSCDEYLDDSNPASNVKFVSPVFRMQSHMTPVDQICQAPWPGMYIFRFDNTYSWFTSRKILFRIREVKESS